MVDKNNITIEEQQYIQLINCKVKNDNGIYIVDKKYREDRFCLEKVKQNGEKAKAKYNIYFLDEKHDKEKQVTIITKEQLKQAAKNVKEYLKGVTANEKIYSFTRTEKQKLSQGLYIHFIKPVLFQGHINTVGGTYEIMKIDDNGRISLHLMGKKGERIADNINGYYQFTPIHISFKASTVNQLFKDRDIEIMERIESTKGEQQNQEQSTQQETINNDIVTEQKKECASLCSNCKNFNLTCEGMEKSYTGCVCYNKDNVLPIIDVLPEEKPEQEEQIKTTFKIGDKVTYTNPNGVVFKGHTVTGFYNGNESTFIGRIYIDSDSPWFPVKVENLKLETINQTTEEQEEQQTQIEESNNINMPEPEPQAEEPEPTISTELKQSNIKITVKYYSINEATARTAKTMNSFYDYKPNEATNIYQNAVHEVLEIAREQANKYPEQAEKIQYYVDKYSKKLADWYNRYYSIECMCPSMMICGGGNFPVRKKERQNSARDKHQQLYNDIQSIIDKIQSISNGDTIIKSGDADAVEKLKTKLEKLQEKREQIKLYNAKARKEGKPQSPRYMLSNLSQNIRNVEQRIKSLEIAKAKPTEEKTEQYNSTVCKVIENTKIMRLQLIFDGKPDTEIRNILKSHGFHWSPSNNAWQRQLTDNARYSTKIVLQQLETA